MILSQRPTRRAVMGLPLTVALGAAAAPDWNVSIEQVTSGPKHHFFGYIGHVKNTPWNGDGRYMALLQTAAQDHMPAPGEAAELVLVDTKDKNKLTVIDRSLAWNPQQGTMLYWNPKAADTQILFNDRDPKSNHIFPVMYDIAQRKRLREYRFQDTPIGNGGVAQNGGFFLGINYGRMARLRPVTGYTGAYDWNKTSPAPNNDGIFLVEIESGRKRLLVAFEQLAKKIAAEYPEHSGKHLFINHTLWNRNDDRIFFFLRGAEAGGTWDLSKVRVNLPCTIKPDGSGLTVHRVFFGGHPEWEFGSRIIGAIGDKQVVYDVDKQELVGQIGTPEILPSPGGDGALSPDGRWFVSGYRVGRENFYSILRRSDGSHLKTSGLPIDHWTSGELRLDAAPCWNRSSDQIAVPAIAGDAQRTRQTFIIRIRKT